MVEHHPQALRHYPGFSVSPLTFCLDAEKITENMQNCQYWDGYDGEIVKGLSRNFVTAENAAKKKKYEEGPKSLLKILHCDFRNLLEIKIKN